MLASSLDYKATLAATARLAVPRLADWCAVDIVDADGRLRRLAIAHADPAKVEAVWAMSHRYPESAEDPVPQVIRSARPQLIPEIPDGLLRAFARNEEHLQALRAFGLRSLLIVPLTARGRILGAITFVLAESGRRFTPRRPAAGRGPGPPRGHRGRQRPPAPRGRAGAAGEGAQPGPARHGLPGHARSASRFVDRELRFVRVNDALAGMIGCPRDGARSAAPCPRCWASSRRWSCRCSRPRAFETGRPVLDRGARRPAGGRATTGRGSTSRAAIRWPCRRGGPVGRLHGARRDRAPARRPSCWSQAERMEAVARVAGGVAHEVNNMMTVITGFSGFLEGSMPAGDPRADDLPRSGAPPTARPASRGSSSPTAASSCSSRRALDLNALVQRERPDARRACSAPASRSSGPGAGRPRRCGPTGRSSSRCWSTSRSTRATRWAAAAR